MKREKDPGPKERILKAAEVILEEDGYAAITTRRLGTTAGINQALVHYHFGSVGQVMMNVLDRIGQQSDEQARKAFDGDSPDAEKWHNYLATVFSDNVSTGFAKRWFETVAMAVNDEEMKSRVIPRFEVILATYDSHLDGVLEALGFEAAPSQRLGLAALIQAAIFGMLLESLVGQEHGRAEMLALFDEILGFEGAPAKKPARKPA